MKSVHMLGVSSLNCMPDLPSYSISILNTTGNFQEPLHQEHRLKRSDAKLPHAPILGKITNRHCTTFYG